MKKIIILLVVQLHLSCVNFPINTSFEQDGGISKYFQSSDFKSDKKRNTAKKSSQARIEFIRNKLLNPDHVDDVYRYPIRFHRSLRVGELTSEEADIYSDLYVQVMEKMHISAYGSIDREQGGKANVAKSCMPMYIRTAESMLHALQKENASDGNAINNRSKYASAVTKVYQASLKYK